MKELYENLSLFALHLHLVKYVLQSFSFWQYGLQYKYILQYVLQSGLFIAISNCDCGLQYILIAFDCGPALTMKDRRRTWLGHVLRMDEDRLVRKVLLNCVTKESLYGDIPDLDVERAIEIAQDREKWEKIRPSQRS